MEEARLLLADAMLGTHAAAYLANVVHHEWLDHSLDAFLQVLVLVAWKDHVEVQVAVTDVSVAIRQNHRLFGGAELR